MKIIHMIYDSPGNPWLNGGGAKRTLALYQHMSMRHDVTVYCGQFNKSENNINGVKFRHLGVGNNYALSRLSYIFCVYLKVLFSRADIYVEDIGFPGPLMLPYIKRNTIGSVQFIPNQAFIEKRGVIGKFVRTLFRAGLRFYRRIITVSEYSASEVSVFTHSKSSITIVPNGIESVTLEPAPLGDYFLFLGRIDIYGKGIDVLMQAISKLKHDSRIKLVVAGDGEPNEIAKLNEMIADYKLETPVSFVGYVVGKQKDDLLAGCRAVVLPSRNETSSLSGLEAMSFGRPVIANDVGGLGEIVRQSGGGVCLQNLDADVLAKALATALTSNDTMFAMGQRGLEYARCFLWHDLSESYEAVLLNATSLGADK